MTLPNLTLIIEVDNKSWKTLLLAEAAGKISHSYFPLNLGISGYWELGFAAPCNLLAYWKSLGTFEVGLLTHADFGI